MDHLERTTDLVVDYIGHMLGCGVHTARVMRCAERISRSQGFSIEMMSTMRHFTLTVSDDKGNSLTRVASLVAGPISFERNTNLSTLSWRALDEHLSLDEISEQFQSIINEVRLSLLLLTPLVGVANACFCKLLGGDFLAAAIVCFATIIGFSLRQFLTTKHINIYIVFALSAFVASICASIALKADCTADIALATSPLFLIPGVPLINGIIDILDSHILVGFSRPVSAFMLILCLSI